MSAENYFFLIFFITILLTRVFIFFKPIPSPTVKNFRLHHYMYGFVLMLASLLIKNITMFAIGLGLFVDELAYLLLRGKTHRHNYSFPSLLGTALFVLFIFLVRAKLIKFVSIPFT